ncbi:MAG: DNA phosphorothioation system sulfurtransferase DndC [Methanosarcinaceae archaeon]|nr:DNA phosphorothioation system sulfurtransferase DndC [Methanosarcinaceae archaeon]
MDSEIAANRSSIFDYKSVKEIYHEIQEVYLRDHRPWVIGYSGGKDSTTALQLIWYAILDLPEEQRQKKIYVISSDTLVETPVIIDYINDSLEKINEVAIQSKMPFEAVKLTPIISESFWVNLIGRGYPAPSKTFRWCTDRLKIKTADRFIIDRVTQYGEVVVVLGVRKSESATRAQVMNLHKIKDSVLSRHSRFPQAFVYTPIEDFSVDDVWSYLLQTPSPWGNNNRDLLALYKSAQAGECPLVVDDTTPSCGNSRFGCWVCTVVTKDKAMEALIDNGEEWLEPLLDFRNYLAETQIPDKKHLFREYKRMNGKVQYNRDGSGNIIRGPYKLEFCKELLTSLLQAQIQIRKNGPNPEFNLILPEELHEIRRMWQMNRGDWQDSLPEIYKEAIGEDLDWVKDDLGMFTSNEDNLMDQICANHDVPLKLVKKLLEAERQVQGMSRRSSIYSKIDDILSEEWRSEEEFTKKNISNLPAEV